MSSTLSNTDVVTRKPHKCHGCIKVYPRGTAMRRWTGKDGGLLTLYICRECDEWMARVQKFDRYAYEDGCTEGEIAEDRAEDARQQAMYPSRVTP